MPEIHISRRARSKYQINEELFSTTGRVTIANYSTARQLAENLSAHRTDSVPASDINAMGLLNEVFRNLISHYETQNPDVFKNGLMWLESNISENELDATLSHFIEEFPPLEVQHGEISVEEYLKATTSDVTRRELFLDELLLLYITNHNVALEPYQEIFNDETLEKSSAYHQVLTKLSEYFSDQGSSENLIEMLHAPALSSPESLVGQLEFILEKWGTLLEEDTTQHLLRGIDFLKEEATRNTGPGGFDGEAPVLDYIGPPQYERFSEDKEWMPRCILMAKNAYVWLEQLSRAYGRSIRYLNDIPDEELDILGQRGFSGLWLIGLWERSRASRRIKQRMGNEDAVASAYSLYSYDIATDLGGWEALEDLSHRARERGIRLSADMVPNHMGIDSGWVIEHPDWFLSLDQPPYPSYTFNSENLSNDSRAAIVLEDHYYNHSDAAVTFKLHHYQTDQTKFIYHGNDGTSIPWNDTAQLDYSKPEVREAVIQTILHVARNFPIIRFDAAMTLSKRHIQRLWFPAPGGGGAIPSRSEHGMSRDEFEAIVPEEFWRQVVDRVAAETPDTLLLAEAFWLMEGYFVRTLGMHRVYNSAFMHMLRDEENAKYRQVIKNTLEYDPQVLKRFVNFMSNPDEESAVKQFGNGDKYFGVCTLLATLPGLPMFGHGQIEGFREKYGMEFRAPKWDEGIDEGLVQGHEHKIFPLLHRRSLFADSEHFLLYDFYTPDPHSAGASSHVNEDVFAYSNMYGEQRGLVIYHNRFAETSGWIKISAAYIEKSSGKLVQKSLAEGLKLPQDGYVIFKDYVTQLEYIRSCEELWERGLFVQLVAYQHHAFMDFQIVNGGRWMEVCNSLNDTGVESVQAKWDEIFSKKEAAADEKKVKKRATKKKATGEKKTTSKKPKAKKKVVLLFKEFLQRQYFYF